ncbi:MAG: ferredoxin family protein [Anaerolineaceae bacterium]|jgi:ferredoxin
MTNTHVLPVIELSLCIRCGACAAACPEHALAMDIESDTPFFAKPEACTYCTECEAVCPQNAIQCPLTITWGTQE